MLRLLVLSCLVAICVAKSPISHCCSAEDRHRVQTQWGALWKDVESAKMKMAFGRRVLLKLAEVHPEVKEAFKNVNIEHPESGEFGAHCMRILNGLDTIINLLDHPEALKYAVEHLAHLHARHTGLKKEYFKTFGQLIVGHGLPHVLDDFDAMSWKNCFKGILSKVAAEVHD